MPEHPTSALSRRERQVMDALYRLGEATVSDLLDEVADDLSYSAVRAVLWSLRKKGRVEFREDGPRYVFFPAGSREEARSSVLRHVVRTFFGGSPEAATVALLRMSDLDLDDETLERIEDWIQKARKEGR